MAGEQVRQYKVKAAQFVKDPMGQHHRWSLSLCNTVQTGTVRPFNKCPDPLRCAGKLFQTVPHDQVIIRANPALTKRPSEVAVSKTRVILRTGRSVLRDARIRPASIPTNVAGMSATVTFNVAELTPASKACNVIATG